jgi:DNA-binding LacI/PurR family transcriptional regulator
MHRASRPSQQRKTLGLFTDWLKDPYQNGLTCAISRACAERDTNLLCFAGGHLDPKGSAWSRRNVLYELAGAHNLDGVIVMGANVGTVVGPEALKQYLDGLALPKVIALAYRLEGIPSVVIDNSVGLRGAIEHLIDVHQRKNIAFIRGPVENTEAEERFEVYRKVLEERGLAVEPRRIRVGDFLRPSGAIAMQAILGGGVPVDAVIGANDLMALGAIDVLKAEGIRVPEEVSVIGFDDIEEARLAIPQLTTVRQSFLVLGREAVRTALAVVNGDSVPMQVTVPTHTVIRRSCGCGANTWDVTEELAGNVLATASHEEMRRRFLEGMASLFVGGVSVNEQTAIELFEAVFAEIAQGNTGEFARQLSELIRSNSPELLGSLSRLMTVIFRTLHAWTEADAERRQRADEIGRQVRASVGDIGELAQGIERVRMQRLALDLSEAGNALASATGFDSVRGALEGHLKALGIRTGYLSLYDDPKAPEAGAKLVWAQNSKDYGVGKFVGQSFETRQLSPFGSLFREARDSIVLEPLFFEQDQLGMLALSMGPGEGVVYETLREQISGAVRVVRLLEKLAAADKGE